MQGNGIISKWAQREPTLTDFMEMDIIRVGETATVVYDYMGGKPVRLPGFITQSANSDFDIREEAFHYYNILREQASR